MIKYPTICTTELMPSKPFIAKRIKPDELPLKSTEYHLGLSMINFKDKLEETPEVLLLRKLQQGLGSLDTHFRFKGAVSKIAPYNRQAVSGSGLNSYMQKHNLTTPVEIINRPR